MGAQCGRDCVSAAVSQELTIIRQPKTCWQDCSSGPTCSSWNVMMHEETAIIGQCDTQAPSYHHFALTHGSPGRPVANWRSRYVLGSELGTGQTATVFQAVALGSRPGGKGSRRVALKRFHQKNTPMFKTELKALMAVGPHPHILRLLESFEGGTQDDAMVVEYCNGGDIYELYAANHGCCMLETYVSQIMRQLVLALQHLVDRRVEHRDVKPENLLLYSASADVAAQVPLIKLADFGWAAIVEQAPPHIPPEGVGSLWYAPPELNPPVRGAEIVADEHQCGQSDMWSVGVITYLLLTGYSPFHLALGVEDPAERELEVMRLAAFGELNTSTKVWQELSGSAKDFILGLLKPDPAKRRTPSDALNHPFITASAADFPQSGGFRLCSTTVNEDPVIRWSVLDDFQRLCWLAIARAFSEPELVEMKSLKDFVHLDGGSGGGYLDRLAWKLVGVASSVQLTQAWADVLALAFLYLDVDCDGFLGADDLAVHLPGGYRMREAAQGLISKWRSRSQVLSMGASTFLTFLDFRHAASAALSPAAGQDDHSPGVIDETIEDRMDAIEQVCRKLADEGFEEDETKGLVGI